MKTRSPDARQVAEIVAIQALTFLADDPSRIGRFLAESGLGPETLREASRSPEFLLAVLDFLLKDAKLVEAFTQASDLPLTALTGARIALGGTDWERESP